VGFLLRAVTYPQGGSITYGFGSSARDYVNFDRVSNPPASPDDRCPYRKARATVANEFLLRARRTGRPDQTIVNTPSGTISYSHFGPKLCCLRRALAC
jgi:hypothetical protein